MPAIFLLDKFRTLLPNSIKLATADIAMWSVRVFPEEELIVANAVEKRKKEFRGGRHSARYALKQLGFPSCSILQGSSREPLFPQLVSGSISHCDDFCVSACALSKHFESVGIDCEKVAIISPEMHSLLFTKGEILSIQQNPLILPILIFSAKESLFKCFFSLQKEYFDFLDIEIIFDQKAARFSYRQAPHSKIKIPTYSSFEGFYVFDKTHVLTACYVVSNNSVGERVRD